MKENIAVIPLNYNLEPEYDKIYLASDPAHLQNLDKLKKASIQGFRNGIPPASYLFIDEFNIRITR